jgi:PAS domain S-box-containing protein
MKSSWQMRLYGRLVVLWNRLTEPHPALTDEAERAKARMLAALHLPLPLLILYFYVTRSASNSIFTSITEAVVFMMMIVLAISYVLSRSRHYRLGVYLKIGALFVIIVVALTWEGGEQALTIMPLYFAHAIILSSMFLNIRTTVALTLATFAVMTALAIMLPPEQREVIVNQVRHLSTLYILVVVSTLVRTHQERQLSQNALTVRESEARYRMLFEETFEPLVIHDKGYIVAMNPEMERVSGYTNADIKGHNLINFVHPDSREMIMNGTVAGAKGLEVKLVTRDGQPVAAQIFTKPITYYGREMRMVSVRDLTNQHAAEAARLEIAIAQERQVVLQKLIRNLSHDFRTPLAVIKTSLYMLERSTNDAQRHQKHLDVVRLQTNRLQEMMDDFIALARLDYARKSDATVEEVDVNHVLRSVVADHQGLADKLKVTLAYHACADETPRLLDKEALQRIAKSLISNGLFYTPADGRVDVHACADADGIHLRVEDTGVGIHPDEIDHIFEPFFRGDPTRSTQTGGAGLGLTIARKHVEVLGGTIHVESQLGAGTTFRVTLPLSHAAPEEDDAIESLPEASPH